MTEEVIVQDTTVLELPTEVEVPVEVPELTYRYQPTDESGRNIGGEQVIKYRTPEELADKMRDNSVHLIRKLRQVTKEARLGRGEDSIPDDAERFAQPVDFQPKPLSAGERYAISQDLNDPEKFEAARDRLLESAIGASPEDLRRTLNQQQITTMQLLARQNAAIFMEKHPEFYSVTENLEVLTNWMIKNRLSPTVANFERANSTMQEAGLLLSPPIVREDAPKTVQVVENTVPNAEPVAPITRISDSDRPQQPSQPLRVPSGLNSRVASNTGVQPQIGALTLADIDRMSSDEYKRRLLTDPKFSEAVDKLEASRPKRAVR
jgi:hypothetical protein